MGPIGGGEVTGIWRGNPGARGHRPERVRERTWKQHSRATWAHIQGADTPSFR